MEQPVRQPRVFEFGLSNASLYIALLNNHSHPGIGGMRRLRYATKEAAINDCKYLAQAMYNKATAYHLPLSGAKAVIYCSDKNWQDHRKQILQEAALKIHSMEGRYITAIDMGTSIEDMDCIKQFTPYVVANNSMPQTTLATAQGVYMAIETTCRFYKKPLHGARVFIEGLGQVSEALIPLLLKQDCQLYAYDIQTEKLQNFPVKRLESHQKVDIFVPNAAGHSVSTVKVDALGCWLICGSANCQLEPNSQLPEGTVYIPDYLANAGGLIYVEKARHTPCEDERLQAIKKITDTVLSYLKHHNISHEPAL